ncbi:hypothetical protein D3C73_1546550 [compost metagenome]
MGRGDTGGAGADLSAGRFQVGSCPVNGDLVGLRVDLENHLTGLHVLVIAHVDADYPARHFRRHWNHERTYPRLLGVWRETISQQIPGQAENDQQ